MSSVVSTFAVFSIVNREFTGNLSDKFSGEYLAAAELIKKEVSMACIFVKMSHWIGNVTIDIWTKQN